MMMELALKHHNTARLYLHDLIGLFHRSRERGLNFELGRLLQHEVFLPEANSPSEGGGGPIVFDYAPQEDPPEDIDRDDFIVICDCVLRARDPTKLTCREAFQRIYDERRNREHALAGNDPRVLVDSTEQCVDRASLKQIVQIFSALIQVDIDTIIGAWHSSVLGVFEMTPELYRAMVDRCCGKKAGDNEFTERDVSRMARRTGIVDPHSRTGLPMQHIVSVYASVVRKKAQLHRVRRMQALASVARRESNKQSAADEPVGFEQQRPPEAPALHGRADFSIFIEELSRELLAKTRDQASHSGPLRTCVTMLSQLPCE